MVAFGAMLWCRQCADSSLGAARDYHIHSLQMLGRVDGFDQDEAADECEE
jgi:hypothetical protein